MKLDTTNLLLLSFALAAGWWPTKAGAYCVGWDQSLPNYDPGYYSISHEFKLANYVVEAKVNQETWIGRDGKEKPLKPPFQFDGPRPWGFDPYLGAYYKIEVVKAFKGSPKTRLQLFSENSTARFWLDVGSEYIFFVTKEDFGRPVGSKLTIDNCGNSASYEKSETTLHSLEDLSRAK